MPVVGVIREQLRTHVAPDAAIKTGALLLLLVGQNMTDSIKNQLLHQQSYINKLRKRLLALNDINISLQGQIVALRRSESDLLSDNERLLVLLDDTRDALNRAKKQNN